MLIKQLVSILNDLLQAPQFKDYVPNGLQVSGREQIKRVATAVTADIASIEQAIDWQADVLLVHHGYFWKGEEPVITGIKKKRLQLLLNHDINLLGYHLPLDCHQTLGNNAQLAKLLNVESIQTHDASGQPNLLWQGKLSKAYSVDEFNQFLTEIFQRSPQHCPADNTNIQTLAWCSGAAQDVIEQAVALGVDAFISGEVSERTFYQAKEYDIHYFGCGHHATERYGVQALGQYLAENYQLTHQFFDSNNPI